MKLEVDKIICHDVTKPFPLPDGCIDVVMTSPPYWHLRNYQVDGQIGLEDHPQIFIDKIVNICDEIKRVLKKSGSFYLNIGDKYKDKQLLMIPSRVVIALQDNGWILRNSIIWHKPNPLPSPFKDRLSNTYEFVFHLVKNKKYYYDLDKIRIPHKAASLIRKEYGFKQIPRAWEQGAIPIPGGKIPNFQFHKDGRNPGDVTEYEGKSKGSGDQFQKICERKNYERQVLGVPHDLATCHPNGKNPGDVIVLSSWGVDKNQEYHGDGKHNPKGQSPSDLKRAIVESYKNNPKGKNPGDFWNIPTQAFTAYNPDLEHFACFPEKIVVNPLKSSCPPGGIVLDPFCGRGTVGKVAKSLGLHYILFDIKPEYCELARLFIGGQKNKIHKNQKKLGGI